MHKDGYFWFYGICVAKEKRVQLYATIETSVGFLVFLVSLAIKMCWQKLVTSCGKTNSILCYK